MTIRKTDMKHTLEVPTSLPETGFLPYNLKYEKSGTSMVHQIGDYQSGFNFKNVCGNVEYFTDHVIGTDL